MPERMETLRQFDIVMTALPDRDPKSPILPSIPIDGGGDATIPVLLGVSLAMELAMIVFMTMIRYRSQNLEPVFLDLTRTGNVVSLLVALPLPVLMVVNALRRKNWTRGRGVAAAALSGTSLALLTASPLLTTLVPSIPQFGYLLFIASRVGELSVLVEWLSRRQGRSWRRRGIDVFGRAVAIAVFSFLMVIASVLISPFGGSIVQEPRGSYDAGVILGAAVWSGDRPSPVLRERINAGYDLYRNGTVQFLVLTGGHAPNEMAEADVARRELVKRGVDPTRIVVETNTSSTLEQVLYLRDQINKRQGWDSFIIISDRFHLKRALEICQFNDLNAVGFSSESPLGAQNLAFYHIRESAALALYWLFGV